jgi:hypothetical protein
MSELENRAKTLAHLHDKIVALLDRVKSKDSKEYREVNLIFQEKWVPLEEAQKLETQKNELAKVFHNEVEGGRLLVDKIENLEAKIVDALKILDEYPNSQHEITYWIGRLRKCLANGEK